MKYSLRAPPEEDGSTLPVLIKSKAILHLPLCFLRYLKNEPVIYGRR
nr:MAG TPA: hypothetical protein [Caudoviricetes sp.]